MMHSSNVERIDDLVCQAKRKLIEAIRVAETDAKTSKRLVNALDKAAGICEHIQLTALSKAKP